MTTLLFLSFIGFLLIGLPVAVALGGASLLYVALTGDLPLLVVVHRMVNGIDSFPLLAVPFFIMAGNLMNSAGITDRIFHFAIAAVGWAKGGLGHVNVFASIIFAGMSGTAVADAGGLGTIEIKAMRDARYPDDFSIGITAASSVIGPIIPPSLPLVIYGVMANTSVGQLFAAGILPGLLIAVMLFGWVAVVARLQRFPRDAAFGWCRLAHATFRAVLPLMTPVILIGGMKSGLFTPTEAAIAATVYALFLGLVAYRTLGWNRLVRVSMETIETTAIILLIVAGASIFGWLVTTTRISEEVAEAVLAITEDRVLVLLIVNLLLLVVGCFLETIAAITILVPVLLPLITKIGVDPVQFGIIMTLNLVIGLLTPPVGLVIYTLARISDRSFEFVTASIAPFLIPLFGALLVVTYWPGFVLLLPEIFYR
ncbi:TRAP transporter large permease [Elioraea sp. Yellowstone]|uniref:TRAP transporter large permease n=1 Tax=Elioraea sp. Yellowstone TaxID=2592070 RepID=UPI00114FE69C|nr:TRAP transporter large permease [Elioraea sp. Yellowstone]TQF81634.1 TRAP transporter large permease [Elioraea sp. Yellowstone]